MTNAASTASQHDYWPTADSILAACADGTVPVNAGTAPAVAAHLKAWGRYLGERSAENANVAGYSLLAVVMGVPRTVTEAGGRLEYLTALPFEAWLIIPRISGGPEQCRDWAIWIASRSPRLLGC